jgi:hypothetical protein
VLGARSAGGSREVKVTWPSKNVSWVGWFDDGIFDSKDASKQLKATGTLTLAAGTIEGEFRHRLGNGVIKVRRFILPSNLQVRGINTLAVTTI